MVDRLKDKEDLKLEALFKSVPIDDDGFSDQIVKRVRRRVWVRRLTLPIAIGLGALISAKPFLQLMSLMQGLLAAAPDRLTATLNIPAGGVVDIRIILGAAVLLATVLMLTKASEDY